MNYQDDKITTHDTTPKVSAMREASTAEIKGVKNYIKSISKDTGVNFFDLCQHKQK